VERNEFNRARDIQNPPELHQRNENQPKGEALHKIAGKREQIAQDSWQERADCAR